MTNIPTWTPVVAVALVDEAGRMLLQQRRPGTHHEGLWEFPGGKVEQGENPRSAAVRELAEELSVVLDPAGLEPAGFAEEGAERVIVLFLYMSRRFAGKPDPQDGQNWGWFTASQAAQLPLAPMDRRLLHQLPG